MDICIILGLGIWLLFVDFLPHRQERERRVTAVYAVLSLLSLGVLIALSFGLPLRLDWSAGFAAGFDLL